jgi:hypothetical protein
MKASSCLFFFLSALPIVATAQTTPVSDSLRQRGELVGSRPATAPARPVAPNQRRVTSDPLQQHLLGEEVNLAQARANELPDLYERFIATTRDERKQWSYRDWEAAAAVLARLNARYGEVRSELPIEERVRIRSFQGEFHTLKGARKVKEKLD